MWKFNLQTNFIHKKRGKCSEFYSQQMQNFVQTIKNQIFEINFPESNLNLTTKSTLTPRTFYFHIKKPVSDKKDVEAKEFEILMSALLYPNDFSKTLNKYDK